MLSIKRYTRFNFLSVLAKEALARCEMTVYDSKFLAPYKKKLSEFLLKEISIKSSMIMILWYSLFDFLYLCPQLFESIDHQYIEMCDRKLLSH